MTLIDENQPGTTDPDPRPEPRPGSRLQRARMPVAADVVEAAAISLGVCIRPVTMKATNDSTGEVEFIDVPCGATLASKCPSCAERARRLRMHQCREGWHLDQEPDLTADASTEAQKELAVERADITAAKDQAKADGDELEAMAHAEAASDVDAQLRHSGVRGNVDPDKPERPNRSTKRRDDAPALPKRDMDKSTVGRSFTGNGGQVFRPSMFLTVTLPSYGKVRSDGTPVNPGTYDYGQAARDAIGFSALLDRLVQNLRRVAGYDVQYFAAVEPQRRLAAHAHFAIRGTIPRAVVRQVVAATYRQIWWPSTGQAVYDELNPPIWADTHDKDGTVTGGGFYDPASGAALTTWAEALGQLDDLDALADKGIGDGAEPFHVLRFGSQIDLQGLLAGTPDSERRIGYLAKYLTKSMTEAHQLDDELGHGDQGDEDDSSAKRVRAHVDRLHAALKLEPCSPACSNWLRYGIQPKNARRGMTPGSCKSKAHKREHLGYAGRRILVSRKWTGKTLADHKHDRRAWVLETLGLDQAERLDQVENNDKTRDQWRWEPAARDDPIGSPKHRLLIAISGRQRWREALDAAREGKHKSEQQLSATSTAAA